MRRSVFGNDTLSLFSTGSKQSIPVAVAQSDMRLANRTQKSICVEVVGQAQNVPRLYKRRATIKVSILSWIMLELRSSRCLSYCNNVVCGGISDHHTLNLLEIGFNRSKRARSQILIALYMNAKTCLQCSEHRGCKTVVCNAREHYNTTPINSTTFYKFHKIIKTPKQCLRLRCFLL